MPLSSIRSCCAGFIFTAVFVIGLTPGGAQDKPAAPTPAAVATSPAAIMGLTWSVVGLEGAPMAIPPDREKPWLKLEAEGKRVTGMGGVNRFSGTYTLEGGALKFSPLMATKMAGPPALNELETRFLGLMQRVTGWQLTTGNYLELLAGTQVIARFSAQPAIPR